MKLEQVLQNIPNLKVEGKVDVEIAGLTYSSHLVQPGFLFAALQGKKADGNEFIAESLNRGARAILSEKPRPGHLDVTWVEASDAREALALAAANFHRHPSLQMKVIGVTGTKGKTTFTYILEAILRRAGFKPAVIGTINYRWVGQVIPAERTTPEAPDLQKMMQDMVSQGTTHCLIEVSSHALDLKRVWGIHFDLAVFTNLSAEHLDYHSTMEDYFESKKKLFFLNQKKRAAIVNLDDGWGKKLILELPLTTISYGLVPAAIVRGQNWKLTEKGIKAEISFPGGWLQIDSALQGQHNLYNILAAVAAGLALNIPPAVIAEGISNLNKVPGRMEKIVNRLGFNVLIDYAHTDVALKSLLEAVRQMNPRRILVVFGAGGDRDRGKRPRMGEVAAALADWSYLTSDNPRTEDPLAILAEIEQGFLHLNSRAYTIIPDRRKAIETALVAARRGDVVCIAGKGHENYQILKDKTIPFNDAEIARSILKTLEKKIDGRTAS